MTSNILRSGLVTQVTADGVWCEIPELAPHQEFGPMEIGPFTFDVGDRVLIGQTSGTMEDFVVIAPLLMSYASPVPTNGKYILVYENAAARDAAGLSLVSGLTVWLDDEQRLEVYTDEPTAGWVQAYTYKSGLLLLPSGSKTGVGVTSPTGILESASTASTDRFAAVSATADTQKRLTVDHAGLFSWGSGTAVADTTLKRASANGLRVDPHLGVGLDPDANHRYTATVDSSAASVYNGVSTVNGTNPMVKLASANTATPLLGGRVTGDTVDRFSVASNGTVTWGTGSATRDVNLYRNGSNELKTDSDFTALGNVTATGNLHALGNLDVDTNGNVDGNLTVGGTATVTGTSTFTGAVTLSNNLTVAGVFDGVRRWVTGNALTIATSGIGNTETTILTIASFTWKADHIYTCELWGLCTASAVPQRPLFRIRRNSSSGTQLFQVSKPCVVASSQHDAGFVGQFKVGASDVTDTLVLTLQGSASFNAQLLSPSILNIYDEGLITTRHGNIQAMLIAI